MVEELKVSQVIGKGAFGVVYRGSYKLHTNCAIKKIKLTKNSKLSLNQIDREFNILLNVKHKSIISVFEVIRLPDSYNIVMEYLQGKDIESILESSSYIELNLSKKWLKRLIKAMRYLKGLNIIHRDIKPSNILLSSPDINSSEVKLIDFGFATYFNDAMLKSRVGTPLYMAPEILNGKPYTFKVDVWSLGVVAFEMFYGKNPFDKAKSLKELSDMQSKPLDFYDHPNVNDEVKELIRNMVQVDPDNRLDYDELLSLPIFKKKGNSRNYQNIQKEPGNYSFIENQTLEVKNSQDFKKIKETQRLSYRNSKSFQIDEDFIDRGEIPGEEVKNFEQAEIIYFSQRKDSKILKQSIDPCGSIKSKNFNPSCEILEPESKEKVETLENKYSIEERKDSPQHDSHLKSSFKVNQSSEKLKNSGINSKIFEPEVEKNTENNEKKVIVRETVEQYDSYSDIMEQFFKDLDSAKKNIEILVESIQYIDRKQYLLGCFYHYFTNFTLKRLIDRFEVYKFYDQEIINLEIEEFDCKVKEISLIMIDSYNLFYLEFSTQKYELDQNIMIEFKEYLNDPKVFNRSKNIHKILIESLEFIDSKNQSLSNLIKRFNFFYQKRL